MVGGGTAKKDRDIRFLSISLVLGILFSIFWVWGAQLQKDGAVVFGNPMTYVHTLVGCIPFALLAGLVLKGFEKVGYVPCKQQKWRPVLYFGLSVCILLAVWLPQLLGVYPGFFCYDANQQWDMYQTGTITAHHPPLHTLLLGMVMDPVYRLTGAFNKAVAAYSLVQMIVCALCFAYALTWMGRKRLPMVFRILALCWFALFPTNVILVFSVTKDTLFGALFTVFITMLIEVLEEPEKKLGQWYFVGSWIVVTFLAATMRNNAVYVMVLFVPVLLWVLRRHWKRVLVYVAGLVLMFGLYKGPFYGAFVTEGISDREFLSVPTQQMMRVYFTEGDKLSAEEKDIIHSLYGDFAFQYYHPKISDAVKTHFKADVFLEHYIPFWADLGLRFPELYVNSFLQNNYGFWYPRATLTMAYDGWEGYLVCRNNYPAQSNSLIPPIGKYLELFEKSSLVTGKSPTVIFFAPATFFWIVLLVFAYKFWKKEWVGVLVLVPVILLWLTFLLGPVVLVRYVSFLFNLFPVVLALIFTEKDAELQLMSLK